jgi:hypothetical protein
VVSLKSLSLICAWTWLGCTPASAQVWGMPDFPRIGYIAPTDSESTNTSTGVGPDFGLNMALDGNTLVATEPQADPPRIAVFTRTSETAWWERSASLFIPVPGSWGYEWKSSKLAVDGDVVLAAIKRTVYVFKRTNGRWNLVQRVKPPSADGVTNFPEKLAFDAGTAVVTGSTPSEGVAYVYTVQADGRLAWKAKLRSLSGVSGDGFGASVDIHNDTIAIGAPGTRSVFVFKRSGSTWKPMQQVMPIAPEGADTFGTTVAVDGNTLVVGAPEAFPEGTYGEMRSGAAYIFALSHGSFIQASVLQEGCEEYGRIVRLTPDRLVVSAHEQETEGYGTNGLSFTYTRSGSTVQLLGIAHDYFAYPWDMVTDGTQLVVSGYERGNLDGLAGVFNIRSTM